LIKFWRVRSPSVSTLPFPCLRRSRLSQCHCGEIGPASKDFLAGAGDFDRACRRRWNRRDQVDGYPECGHGGGRVKCGARSSSAGDRQPHRGSGRVERAACACASRRRGGSPRTARRTPCRAHRRSSRRPERPVHPQAEWSPTPCRRRVAPRPRWSPPVRWVDGLREELAPACGSDAGTRHASLPARSEMSAVDACA